MRKVTFEYRQFIYASDCCLFIATHEDGRTWETMVALPYEPLHAFWDEDQYSIWVTKVSRTIAREKDAPLWVMH